MGRPKKIATKVTDTKKLRTYRTRTEEDKEKIPLRQSPKGHMETVVIEELYNACKQNLVLGGKRFVPGDIIPKEFLTEASQQFYLQGGHIASRNKMVTRKLK